MTTETRLSEGIAVADRVDVAYQQQAELLTPAYIFKRASSVIETYGKSELFKVDIPGVKTSERDKLLGQERHRVTPPVHDLEGEVTRISLSEETKKYNGYQLFIDGIAIREEKGEGDDVEDEPIFYISQDEVRVGNSRGQMASPEQKRRALERIEHIGRELERRKTEDEFPVLLQRNF